MRVRGNVCDSEGKKARGKGWGQSGECRGGANVVIGKVMRAKEQCQKRAKVVRGETHFHSTVLVVVRGQGICWKRYL